MAKLSTCNIFAQNLILVVLGAQNKQVYEKNHFLNLLYTYQPMETVLRKTRESTGVNCRNVCRRVRCQ